MSSAIATYNQATISNQISLECSEPVILVASIYSKAENQQFIYGCL